MGYRELTEQIIGYAYDVKLPLIQNRKNLLQSIMIDKQDLKNIFSNSKVCGSVIIYNSEDMTNIIKIGIMFCGSLKATKIPENIKSVSTSFIFSLLLKIARIKFTSKK